MCLDVQVFHGVGGVDDHGDAVVGKDGADQTGRNLGILQRTGGQADVAAAFGYGGDAGAGAGGVIGEVYAGVLLP